MRFRLLLPAILLLAVTLIGCGGGGGSSTPPPPGTKLTRVYLTVNWPERSRDITALSSALSVNVVLKNATETGSDLNWTINRGTNTAAFTQKYTSPIVAKTGTWDLSLKLYSKENAQGVVVGEVNGTATVADDGSGLPSFNIAGKIVKVSLATNRNVPVGQQRDLPFSATDSGGNVVPVTQGSAVWQIVAGQDKLRFVNGRAEGIANGTASVKATVDGQTSDPVLVSVGTEDGRLTVNAKDPTGTLIDKGTVTLLQSGFQVKQTALVNGTITFNSIAQGATEILITAPGFHNGQATTNVVTAGGIVDIPVTPSGTPVATNLETRLIGTTGDKATFETDIAVTDEAGQSITGLSASSFLIDPINNGTSTLTFQQNSAALVDATPRGSFSAFMLVDATESMRGSDTTNSRIQGLKAFWGSLPGGSSAMFGYFPSASGATTLKAYPEVGFTANGLLYYSKIDALKTYLSLAGTPLYDSTLQAIDLTAASAGPQKAVVILTDGHDNNSAANLAQAVNAGKTKGVRVFTLNLGLQTYAGDMAELAQRTGGGTALATNPLQLTSFYKSLSALLLGQVKVYRVRWTATRDVGDFPAGSTVSGTVKIPQQDGVLIVPFFVPVK